MHSAHVYPIAEVFLGSPVSDSHTEDKGDRQCLGEKGFFSAIHRVTSQVAGWRLVSMALAAPPPDAPLLAEGDTTLSVPCHCSRLSLPPVRRHCLLGNESGQRGGGSGVPSSNQSHKKDGDWVLGTRQILGLRSRTEVTMAQSTKIQAACLLLLLIASLTSSTLLQQLVSTLGLLRCHPQEAGAPQH